MHVPGLNSFGPGQRTFFSRAAIHTNSWFHYLTYELRIVVFLLTPSRLASHVTYDVLSPRPCLPSPSLRLIRVAPLESVVANCLFELLRDSVLLARC